MIMSYILYILGWIKYITKLISPVLKYLNGLLAKLKVHIVCICGSNVVLPYSPEIWTLNPVWRIFCPVWASLYPM